MFVMAELPFELGSWEPYISAKTMDFHYNKHYKGYLDKLNQLSKDTIFETMPLEEVVRESYRTLAENRLIYNNAAQVWNHEFFWHSLGMSEAEKKNLHSLVEAEFVSLSEFKKQFREAGLAQFGSGWCWLVRNDSGVAICKTSNADNPLISENSEPLLCLDVWEHAYYLDYQNRRGDFIDAFLDNLF